MKVFGLTSNQAKVYLTIVHSGSISVSKIAEKSNLHRQDIYKILPKLETKGLIIRTLGTPTIIKSIPVRKALKTLASMEKIKASQKVKRIFSIIEEISNMMNMLSKTAYNGGSVEPEFSLLTKENEIKNRTDLLYENAKTSCDIVASQQYLNLKAMDFWERFQNAAKNGANIRLIIESSKSDANLYLTIDKVKPSLGYFAVKIVKTKMPKPFQIIDHKEILISTAKKQNPSELQCVFWSNGENIVKTYQERFERLWGWQLCKTIATRNCQRIP